MSRRMVWWTGLAFFAVSFVALDSLIPFNDDSILAQWVVIVASAMIGGVVTLCLALFATRS